MIPRSQQAIYVHLPDGKIAPLLPDVMAEAFCKSQSVSGHLEPWQVQEMVEALIYYLRADLRQETIELEDLISALRELGAVCGFDAETRSEAAVASADLYQLARGTGYGFELGFFQSVERSIQEFRSRDARLVRFVRLRSCVKMLVGAKNWCKSCQRLSDEIVAFIRSHMQQWSHERPILIAVS